MEDIGTNGQDEVVQAGWSESRFCVRYKNKTYQLIELNVLIQNEPMPEDWSTWMAKVISSEKVRAGGNVQVELRGAMFNVPGASFEEAAANFPKAYNEFVMKAKGAGLEIALSGGRSGPPVKP
jgi:hypothetical protein|tara:strand:+ start:3100 stop:3468 length:369 start_codon:yes stop_codon:yes gene_type:complete